MGIIETARTWVYSASVRGTFQRLHRASGLFLQAVLFVTPWLAVGEHPAVQIDVPARRLYAFGAIFTPTDTVLLVLMGLFAAFFLFLFTAVYGRLWCGFACPQTVVLEEWVRPVEAYIEGERGVRMARDKGRWTLDKAGRKLLKFTFFGVLSGGFAMTFVSWFAGATVLWTGRGGVGYYGLVAFLSVLSFLDLAWFREQFCNYLCPYARLQGVLCDDHSLVVAYDAARGEPRSGVGACIDCNKCVAVCPQGIDIRNGFQLECITCARCVDACQIVMDKRGQVNLVGYTTQSGRRDVVRPRTVAYTALLGVVGIAFVAALATHDEIDGNVRRSPGSTYTLDADGWVRNTYLVRVTSHDEEPHTWSVKVDGLPGGAQVIVAQLTLAGEETATVPLVVRVPAAELVARSLPVDVVLTSGDDTLSLAATFLSEGG